MLLQGPVAQRITRLTTDQKIGGSNPLGIEIVSEYLIFFPILMCFHNNKYEDLFYRYCAMEITLGLLLLTKYQNNFQVGYIVENAAYAPKGFQYFICQWKV